MGHAMAGSWGLFLAFALISGVMVAFSYVHPCMPMMTCLVSKVSGLIAIFFLGKTCLASCPQSCPTTSIRWLLPFQSNTSQEQHTDFKHDVLPLEGYTFRTYKSIDSIGYTHWDALTSDDVFLQRDYLRALELHPPHTMSFRYLTLLREGVPVGAAYVQLLELDLAQLGEDVDQPWIRRVLSLLGPAIGVSGGGQHLRVLMCGNALGSGEHAVVFSSDVEAEEGFRVLSSALQKLARSESRERPVTFIAVKDFSQKTTEHTVLHCECGYQPLTAEPMMAVTLRPEWNSFDDYMGAMTKKYRKRVRDARKKGAGLSRRSLQAQEILHHAARIDALFVEVLHRAGFRLARITAETFASLKTRLGERLIFDVYELEGEIVGFKVSLLNKSYLDAYLVGIDYEVNRAHCLYQNMLYDFVELGLDMKKESVHMGRTALEIKSCVGAEAQEMSFYVRHPQTLPNTLLKPFFSLAPEKEWTPRHPFSTPS
tara:strand:+ start:10544 stop:11992 length:1449 start_codon:yes stop_codon:yes gene_type:complete